MVIGSPRLIASRSMSESEVASRTGSPRTKSTMSWPMLMMLERVSLAAIEKAPAASRAAGWGEPFSRL